MYNLDDIEETETNENELYPALNKEQMDAAHDILEWIDLGDKREYILEGRAGTGKSYTVGQIPFQSVIGVAVSHSAKDELYKSFDEQIDCFTLAQIMGKEKVDDYSTGISSFSLTKGSGRNTLIQELRRTQDLIILIDEASMISKLDRIEVLKLYPYARILYIGDPYQIPPIFTQKEKQDKKLQVSIFNDPDLEKSHLKENQRCGENNPLMTLLNSIIASQIDEKDHYSKHLGVEKNLNKNGIGYLVNKSIGEFWNDDTWIICFTNQSKKKWNQLVRKNVYNRTSFIEPGDKLIFNTNIYKYISGENVRVHTNSDILKVDSVEYRDVTLHYFDRMEHNVRKSKVLTFVVVNEDDTFYIPTQGAESVLESMIASTKEAANGLHGHARKNCFRQYFKLLGYTAKTSFAYAITAHKAQGKTYDKVIVDHHNIMVYPSRFISFVDRLKLLYVSASRAKSQVLFIKRPS